MRRSRLAAARAGHVRKRGQPCGRQRNVGSPRGPHLMVSTSMVYGCIIDVFNTENISAECSGEKPPSRPRIPCVYGLEVGGRRRTWLWGMRVPVAVSRLCRERRAALGRVEDVVVAVACPLRCFALCAKGALLWDGWGTWLLRQLIPTTNYPWHTCANDCSCYTCNCCFRAGWNSPLVVNRAVPRGYRGAGKVPAVEPMSPRPGCALVRMPAELVRSQYQRLESG